jgi:hypothetical protein
MRLRTFNGDIALIVGSFFLDRAAPDQAQELERLWFKNGSMASQSNIVKHNIVLRSISAYIVSIGGYKNPEATRSRYQENQLPAQRLD